MTKIHEFDPVIYPFNIWIVVDRKPDIISKNFNENDGAPINFSKDELKSIDGLTISVQNKENGYHGAIMYFKSKKSMDFELVSHESCHAAKLLFEYIHAEITDHEPFEYVVGWVAKCCEKVKMESARVAD